MLVVTICLLSHGFSQCQNCWKYKWISHSLHLPNSGCFAYGNVFVGNCHSHWQPVNSWGPPHRAYHVVPWRLALCQKIGDLPVVPGMTLCGPNRTKANPLPLETAQKYTFYHNFDLDLCPLTSIYKKSATGHQDQCPCKKSRSSVQWLRRERVLLTDKQTNGNIENIYG